MPTFSNGEVGLSIRNKINAAIEAIEATTPVSVKTDYESNADTNAFTDAEKAFLAAITASATELNYTVGVTSALQTQIDALVASGSGDMLSTNNLSDVLSASTSLSNLGGQPLDATLTSIAALGTVADRGAYTTAADTWAEFTLTAAGRALLDDTTAADQLVTLGLTATAAELNTLDGITATVSELNALDGITATVTELNYTDGVTSNIQTQLDAKPSATAINTVTASRSLALTDASDILAVDTSLGAVVLTIDPVATTAYPVGTIIGALISDATNSLTITGGTGVTVNSVSAGSGIVTNSVNSEVSLLHRASNVWSVVGDIGAFA